jgi:N-acetyl-anhydromuramyl-L-alanine amidase AmpD
MSVAYWAGYPKSYTPGRARAIQYIVVHVTVGPEGPNSAENGVAYDKTRTDGTSTHVFVDSNTVAREVPDGDRAHAARYHGNEIGLQMEICSYVQNAAQWADATSQATLRLAAKMAAEWCTIHGIPVRRLSVNEVSAAYYNSSGSRPKGICGHVDVTHAYPEDGGTHTDPGAEFPWSQFLQMVQQEMSGGTVDMPKLFILTDGNPTNKVCISDGVTYRWLTDDLDEVMSKWGLAFPPDSERYTLVQAAAYFGKDIADLQGPKGDKGDPGDDGAGFGPNQTVFITGTATVE